MLVGVLEIAGVAAPEGFLRGFGDGRAGVLGLRHERIDFGPGADVVRQREAGGAGVAERNARIVGKAGAWPDRQLQPGLQVEKGDGTMFKLAADDSFTGQTEAVAVEAQCPFKVINGERDEGNSCFYGGSPSCPEAAGPLRGGRCDVTQTGR